MMRKLYASLVLIGFIMFLSACQTRLRPIENITIECDTVRWIPRENVVHYDVFLNGEAFRVMSPAARLENIPQGTYSLTIEYTTNTQRSARSQTFNVESSRKLEAPANVSIEDDVLTFDPVPGATGYVILVGEERFETREPRLDLGPIDRPDFYVVEVSALPSSTCQHDRTILSDHSQETIFEFNYSIDVSKERSFSFALDEIDFLEANLMYGSADMVSWQVVNQVLEFSFSPLTPNQSEAVVLIETGLGTGVLQFSFSSQEAPFLITPSTQTYQDAQPIVFEFNQLSEVQFELLGPQLQASDYELSGNQVRILASYLDRYRETNESLLILQYRLIRGQDVQIGYFFILFD